MSEDQQEKINEAKEVMLEASSIGGGDLGGYWNLLCEMWDYAEDHGSEEFVKALYRETLHQARRIGTEFKIVEKEIKDIQIRKVKQFIRRP